jgi:hypothetical protein
LSVFDETERAKEERKEQVGEEAAEENVGEEKEGMHWIWLVLMLRKAYSDFPA